MIRDDFDIAAGVGDFGRAEADAGHRTFESVDCDGVADAELFLDQNRHAGDKIFNHILEGEADDGGQNTEAGDERRDIYAEVGKDD